jgi:hypothetical protein
MRWRICRKRLQVKWLSVSWRTKYRACWMGALYPAHPTHNTMASGPVSVLPRTAASTCDAPRGRLPGRERGQAHRVWSGSWGVSVSEGPQKNKGALPEEPRSNKTFSALVEPLPQNCHNAVPDLLRESRGIAEIATASPTGSQSRRRHRVIPKAVSAPEF